jgi:spore germination protein GerM
VAKLQTLPSMGASILLSGIIFLNVFRKNIMTDKKNEDSSKEKSSVKETEKARSNSSAKEQSDAESTRRNNDETEKTQQEQKETD